MKTLSPLVFLLGLAFAVPANAGVLGKTIQGKPAIKRIDALEFGPEGVLFIGDGAGAQIFAIQTGEKSGAAKFPAKIAGINARLAEKLGAKPDGIELLDFAISPTTGTAYFAVRKQDDKTYVVLSLRGEEIGLLDLDNVTHARIPLPSSDSAKVAKVTDIAWAEDRLVAGATANEEFASKIFLVRAPLNHEEAGELHSAETYHVAHRRWETKAPMNVILPFTEGGQTWLAGAFSCTPVVKYPLDSLQSGAKVKGTSVLEIGSGNRPLDMFTYEKDGKEYILASTFRFHHEKTPFGPSPYWTVRFERTLLAEQEAVNEKALQRLQGGKPATPRVQMIEGYHGVMQMDRLGKNDAAVLRAGENGAIDFEVLALP
jgi:hypothetical protein